MKKIVLLLCTILLVFAVFGCDNSSPSPEINPDDNNQGNGGTTVPDNPSQGKSVVGRWEAKPAIPGVVETYWFEFNSDGSMKYGEKSSNELIGSSTYEGTYSVNGNMINIKLPSYSLSNLQDSTVKFEITADGQFWFPDKNDGSWGSNQNFDKFSKASSEGTTDPDKPSQEKSVVGRWEAKPAIPGVVETYWFEFNSDGSMKYGEKSSNELIGSSTYEGTYSVNGNMINIKLPSYSLSNLQDSTVKFEITADGQFWFPDKNDGSWGSNQNFDKFSKVSGGETTDPDNPGGDGNTEQENASPAEWFTFTLNEDGNGYTITGSLSKAGEIVIPSRYNGLPVTAIGEKAFYRKSMTTITIPDTVVDIGPWAFRSNSNLTTVNMGNSVTEIGDYSFADCTKLKTINLSESLVTIGSGAFFRSGLNNIVISASVKTIKASAFKESKLRTISFNGGVERLEDQAFQSCSNLRIISLKEGVKYIGNACFAACSDLTVLDLPNSLEYIGEGFISQSRNVKEIIIPANAQIVEYTFQWASNNTIVNVAEDSKYCKKIDGGIYTKDGKTLYFWSGNSADIELAYGVERIGDIAFWENNSIQSVTFPSSLKTISGAFQNCSNLKTVNFNEGLITIGANAFFRCSNLNKINIPSTVKDINYQAFYMCNSLTDIFIPANVSKVGSSAFNTSKSKTITVTWAEGNKPSEWDSSWTDSSTIIKYNGGN